MRVASKVSRKYVILQTQKPQILGTVNVFSYLALSTLTADVFVAQSEITLLNMLMRKYCKERFPYISLRAAEGNTADDS